MHITVCVCMCVKGIGLSVRFGCAGQLGFRYTLFDVDIVAFGMKV